MSLAEHDTRPAAAGRSGPDVRSDLRVALEPAPGGGLQLELRSRVRALYGQALTDQVTGLLHAAGFRHGRVVIDDHGALPFAVAARVEAALRRAGFHEGDLRPPGAAARVRDAAGATDAADAGTAARPPSPRDRLRRSRLYLPGNEPKFMPNAGLHRPDAVILDLEDSVHPDAKDEARFLVRNALRCLDFGAAERMVRINQLPRGLLDLEAIVPEHPDLVLVPKVEDPDQLRAVAARIRELQAALGDEERPIWLMPILESALGIELAFGIARAAATVVALTLGLEDYTADLGVPKTKDGAESLHARMRVVNAARAAGLQAIDSVYGDVADDDGLRAWTQRSRALGFEGMGCVHPRQIPIIHDAYDPTPDEVAKARRIVVAFDEASAAGLGVVALGSKMIDLPVVIRARRVVDAARRAGRLPAEPDEAAPATQPAPAPEATP
jgi:citrate lyase subunit beta / citryl-CoA lyase